MAKQKISDAILQVDIEYGAELFGLQTQSYGKFLIGVIERAQSPKRLKAFGSGFGDDARAALRAVELGLISAQDDDAWKIRKAILCAKCKSGEDAISVFGIANDDASIPWDEIKTMVRERNGTERKERGASLAAKVADYVQEFRGSCVYVSDTINKLERLEPIARELARREKAEAKQ